MKSLAFVAALIIAAYLGMHITPAGRRAIARAEENERRQAATKTVPPPAEIDSRPDEYGFVAIPAAAAKTSGGRIVIVAPANCPEAAGQRADALERALSAAGAAYVRTDEVDASGSSEEIARQDPILRGELPIVFIAGRAKNNPDVSVILAEYRKTGGR